MVGYVSIFRGEVFGEERAFHLLEIQLPAEGGVGGKIAAVGKRSLVASADFKSVGPALVGSVGGFDSLALPPIFVEFCFLGG